MNLSTDFLACSCTYTRQNDYRDKAREFSGEIDKATTFGKRVKVVFDATHAVNQGCAGCLPHIGRAIVDAAETDAAISAEEPELQRSKQLEEQYQDWKAKKFPDEGIRSRRTEMVEEKPSSENPKTSSCDTCTTKACQSISFDLSPL